MTDRFPVSDTANGLSRYVDDTTALLNVYAASFEDTQQGYIRASNRGDTYSAEELKKHTDRLSRRLRKTLEQHVLWDWLEPLKGLAGARTARIIAAIGDPRRFPGQQCSEGHTLPPLFDEGVECPVPAVHAAENERTHGGDGSDLPAEGDGVFDEIDGGFPPDSDDAACESEDKAARCPGVMLPPRTSDGRGSLNHYAGLHVVNGKLPQRRKGQQADWKPLLRTLLIGPKGIGDMIVMHRTPKYRDIYDSFKDRRPVTPDFPPWRIDKIAKTVAAKAFVGDLLTEWKARAGYVTEIEGLNGSNPPQAIA
jgi:hypothetical protein